MRFRFLASAVLASCTLLPLALLAGCSSKDQLGGQGASCNVVTDCQDGLICLPQKSGNSICSSNVGSVTKLPPIPDAGAQAAQDAAPLDDAPGIVIPQDSGTPQTD